MGREVRMVPPDWEHPRNEHGSYIPLKDCYDSAMECYKREMREWMEHPEPDMTFDEWYGGEPQREDYMPDWPEEECTHYMMYENTTEGTPKSPAFSTPEELARWLADNKISAFADMTATYDQWLATIKAGYAPSAVISNGRLESGVEHDW